VQQKVGSRLSNQFGSWNPICARCGSARTRNSDTFAADKHRNQRRKDEEAWLYI
jgi:hypothetical protein